MSARPRLQPFSRSKLGRLVLGCLMATLVLMLSPAALAMTLVPMCGERAETIAAPPTMRATNDSSISAPCQPSIELSSEPATPSRSPEAAPLESAPRLPPVHYRLPRSAQPERTLLAEASGSERPGHARELDRPPR